jgi:hypothetical protein
LSIHVPIFLQNRKTNNFDYQKSRLTLISDNRKLSAVMEPAKTIIEKLGGESVVSTITETAYTAPYRWQAAREKGGTGGLIPQRHHPKLLSYAQEHQIDLTPGDFLPAAEATACVQ